MLALKFTHIVFLASNEALYIAQWSQLKDLKYSFEQLSCQIVELKAENTKIRKNVKDLMKKVATLKFKEPANELILVASLVLQDTFGRERCVSNILAFNFLSLFIRLLLRKFQTIENLLRILCCP